MLFILFKMTHVFSNKFFIIEYFFDDNIGKCQNKSKVSTYFDPQPFISMYSCIGIAWIQYDEFQASSSGTLKHIHSVWCKYGFRSVGSCHDDIRGIFHICFTISTQGKCITSRGGFKTNGRVINKVFTSHHVTHKLLKRMLSHSFTCTET